MSQNDPTEQEAPTPPPNAELLPIGKVALFGFAALALFGVSVLVTFFLMEHWRQGPPPQDARVPSAVGQAQINLLDQTVYPQVDPALQNADARQRLRTYGWVDPHRRLIHVPVERAMNALVAHGEGGW